jgi:hypothetical protein
MSSPTGAENRRSKRILRRVPLRLESGLGPAHEAYSAVINLHGGLVISPIGFQNHAIVALTNLINGAVSRARVVWSGGLDAGTGFKLGVELLDGVDFWGDAYDPGPAG